MIEDDLEYYEELYDPEIPDGRRGKLQPGHRFRKAEELLEEVAETRALEGGLNVTYSPSRHEEGWLLSSLRPFFEQQLITDVLAVVKGGKEASVYRCLAHDSTGEKLLAAKVYRPRRFRNLRNDKMYREGREILTSDGRPVKNTDHRIMRALGKKTAFGVQVAHTSWLMHEYNAMQRLHEAGAAVPKAFAASDNAILMSYLGDENVAAPALNEIDLGPGEPEPLWQEMLRNVELMLGQGLIHGDLSAYNVLYWEGQITIIDFPQVTDCRANRNARFIFQRDVARICQYFATQGVTSDPALIAEELWRRYLGDEPDQAALAAEITAEIWEEQ